jgi:hypothetical protein
MIAEAVLRLPLIYLVPLIIARGASAAFVVAVIGCGMDCHRETG